MSAQAKVLEGFAVTEAPPPHVVRAKQLLAAHPEIRALFGRDLATFGWTITLVAVQVAISIALVVWSAPWWAILLVAYVVGAFANHALFVLIHDYTHNLVFRTTNANRLGAIFANIPIVFPAAIGFRNFHLLHHRHLGVPGLDPDVPSEREARWIGNSRWKKALWVGMFWVVQGITRPNGVKSQRMVEPWSVLNGVCMAAAMAPLVWLFGWWPPAYLFLSTMFALGLHPVGARWFQEHYVFSPGQETYSYYGPLNRLSFNMGYHNEHHDFPSVPWRHLPAIRAAAPEVYDGLYHHTSWTRLLGTIILDRGFTPFRRIVRRGT
ncbi:MAG: fatty acid desaturase [Sphingomonadales bacterium]